MTERIRDRLSFLKCFPVAFETQCPMRRDLPPANTTQRCPADCRMCGGQQMVKVGEAVAFYERWAEA